MNNFFFFLSVIYTYIYHTMYPILYFFIFSNLTGNLWVKSSPPGISPYAKKSLCPYGLPYLISPYFHCDYVQGIPWSYVFGKVRTVYPLQVHKMAMGQASWKLILLTLTPLVSPAVAYSMGAQPPGLQARSGLWRQVIHPVEVLISLKIWQLGSSHCIKFCFPAAKLPDPWGVLWTG